MNESDRGYSNLRKSDSTVEAYGGASALEHEVLERRLLTRLTLRQLSMFAAVYEQRNIVRASRQLSLTQSTISKAIAAIEANLDFKLFVRSPRGVSPTPFGEVLFRYAKAILSEFHAAANELARVGGGETGRVLVGVTPASTAVLARAISSFKADHPSVVVRVVQATDEALLEMLRVGELDFAFGRVYAEYRRGGLERQALFDDPLRIIARRGHPLAKRRALKLVDVAGFPWVLPQPDAYIRAYIDRAFIEDDLDPPANTVETVSINLTRSMLLSTDSLTASPIDTYGHEIDTRALVVLPVDLGVELNPIGLTQRANDPLQPPASLLAEQVIASARAFESGLEAKRRRKSAR